MSNYFEENEYLEKNEFKSWFEDWVYNGFHDVDDIIKQHYIDCESDEENDYDIGQFIKDVIDIMYDCYIECYENNEDENIDFRDYASEYADSWWDSALNIIMERY